MCGSVNTSYRSQSLTTRWVKVWKQPIKTKLIEDHKHDSNQKENLSDQMIVYEHLETVGRKNSFLIDGDLVNWTLC